MPRVQRAHLDSDMSAKIVPSSSLYLLLHARLAPFQRLPLTTVYRESSRCQHPPSRSALGFRFACGLGVLKYNVYSGVAGLCSAAIGNASACSGPLVCEVGPARLVGRLSAWLLNVSLTCMIWADCLGFRRCTTALCVAFSLSLSPSLSPP